MQSPQCPWGQQSPPSDCLPLGPEASELVKNGFQRRFEVPTARRDEVVALYERLGFEVVEVPVSQSQVPSCCRPCLAGSGELVTIFTRKTTPQAGPQ